MKNPMNKPIEMLMRRFPSMDIFIYQDPCPNGLEPLSKVIKKLSGK